MVNSWTPWLAVGCQSMEYFEFILEAIIDSSHVVLNLSMDKM